MRTTMKVMTYVFMGISIIATSCKKDNLEDTVLPQAVQSEQNESNTNSTGETSGTNGTNGTDGSNGADGTNGVQGETGEQGPAGTDGVDGQDGITGPKGDTGAQGVSGADGVDGTNGVDGVDGANGQTGAQGIAGADGNANVYFSDRFFPDWNDIDGTTHKRMIITNPEFSKVHSGGVAVFVYWSTNNGTTLVLPKNYYNSDGTLRLSRSYLLRGGNKLWLETRKYGADFVDRETEGKVGTSTFNQIRYIIVPSGSLSSKSSLDYSKYEAVKKFYNIID